MKRESIVLGGGCFWCVEAAFNAIDGVLLAESGYSGGHVENPTYEQICNADTGHAEVVKVEFDADKISLREVLVMFFSIHDPTTLNRQGNDVGPQYRSAVYTTVEGQLEVVRAFLAELERERVFSRPIVTEVAPLKNYYVAEDYHQRYFEKHPYQGYCMAVIAPKMAKFRKQYATRLR